MFIRCRRKSLKRTASHHPSIIRSCVSSSTSFLRPEFTPSRPWYIVMPSTPRRGGEFSSRPLSDFQIAFISHRRNHCRSRICAGQERHPHTRLQYHSRGGILHFAHTGAVSAASACMRSLRKASLAREHMPALNRKPWNCDQNLVQNKSQQVA